MGKSELLYYPYYYLEAEGSFQLNNTTDGLFNKHAHKPAYNR